MKIASWNPHDLLAWALAMIVLALVSSDIGMSAAVPLTTNISNTSGESIDPVIAASGSNVYISWVDDTSGDNNIVFIMSNDGGETFGDQITFDDEGDSTTPRVTASESNVYVVWTASDDVFIAASNDTGATFSDPVNLSSDAATSASASIVASGSNVYVMWVDGDSSSADIKLVASNNAGNTFSDIMTLVDEGPSSDPRIATSGSNVYLAWKANVGNNEIFFAASNDTGATFGDPVNLSANTGSSVDPAIAVEGTNVHVAWADSTPTSRGILVVSSNNGGASFDSGPAVLNVDDFFARLPVVAISSTTGEVYISWQVLVDADNGIEDIFFSSSNDTGATFSDPVNLSSNPGSSIAPAIASSSSGVFVAWRDNFVDPANNEILATFIANGEQDFISPINLSNSPSDTSKPGIAVTSAGTETAAFVMYEVPTDFSPSDIFFQTNIDFSETTISIDSVSNDAPRWDIDTVSVSGTLSNTAAGDSVTVDWGDGNVTTGIAIEGSNWGPVEHQYTADTLSNNPIQLIAHLLDSSSVTKASSSAKEINVQPHSSALELEPIGAVQPGDNVTISGILEDADASIPIAGASVTLNGSGVDSLSIPGDIVTDSDGTFSVTGPSPNSTADDWTVQAHFDGNLLYGSSDSDLVTYATLSSDAVQYNITSGQNSTVELTNLSFNASITFENVLEDGAVFVSECTSPPSERYLSMGICLEASSALILEEASDITVTVFLDEIVIDNPDVLNDIDMFHEGAFDDITDITKSRDVELGTVSGVATGLSKFIVGAAVHSAEPEGAFRQQVFVSSEPDNEINFRDISDPSNSTAQITLDKESYRLGDTATLTIVDPEGNVDPSEFDIVTAGIISETSDPDGISIVLHETGISSGIFQGTFGFQAEPSSGNSLQARNGDKLTVAYNIPARAEIVLDGISEAGLLQITDFVVPQDASFVPFGGAIRAELVDASLSEGSRVGVTLSYANANIGGSNPENMRIVQEVEEGVWIDITERDAQGNVTGVDIVNKTISGETGSLGAFSIGGDIGIIGGAGGGLARPGSGLVVDFVASVVARSGGGGGGSSTSPSVGTDLGQPKSTEVVSGDDVQAVVSTDKIVIEFGSVLSEGTIFSKEVIPDEFPAGSFSEVMDNGAGVMSIDESTFQTVGRIYDLTVSHTLSYNGSITLTLPYDEKELNQTGINEQDLRLVHYINGQWEDTTISIDINNNTVTGELTSLSPVAIASVTDGTFSKAYFDIHPLSMISKPDIKIADSDTELSSNELTRGRSVTFFADLHNLQRVEQPYVFVVQVSLPTGVVDSILVDSGTLGSGASSPISARWESGASLDLGTYTVMLLVISSIEEPQILAQVATSQFELVAGG